MCKDLIILDKAGVCAQGEENPSTESRHTLHNRHI